MADRNKATIGRRQLLRTGMVGLLASATTMLETAAVAAETETGVGKRKARFQANAAEVQTFYRVNRYPKR
jgi:hypothetical protein